MPFGTFAPVLVLCLLLTGCVSPPLSRSLLDAPPDGLVPDTSLGQVPFFSQEQYQCGPAALAMVLSASGVPVAPEDLIDDVYVPGRHGSYQVEMLTAARTHGRIAYLLEPSLEDVLREVAAGNPVLVFQNLGLSFAPQWHYAVVKGYDLPSRQVILHSGTLRDYRVTLGVFERTWARAGHWALVTTAPGQLPVTAQPEKVFTALSALTHSAAQTSSLAEYHAAAAARWPDNANLQMAYANLLYEQGDIARASAVFERLVSRQPDYAPALNNLAYILYLQRRLAEALGYAERAVAIGGEFNTNYQDTLRLISADLAQ